MAKSKVKNNLSVEPKLEGNRWYIRRAVDVADSIVVKSESISQAVIIEDCKNSSIIIDGKVAALIIDSCSKLSVHFTHVVSNVELLKCENSKLFVQGMTPTIVMDDCEGIQVTLETLEAAKNSTILSSKCSEINVIVPSVIIDKNSADDDLVELPLPFQFKSRIDTTTGKLVTEAVEHIGA